MVSKAQQEDTERDIDWTGREENGCLNAGFPELRANRCVVISAIGPGIALCSIPDRIQQ
jgi:hypothetical protein